MADRPSYEMIEYSWFQISGVAPSLPRPHYVGRGFALHKGYDSRTIAQAPMANHGVFKIALGDGGIVGHGERFEPLKPGQGVLRVHGKPDVWDAYNPRHRGGFPFIRLIFTGDAALAMLHAAVQQYGDVFDLGVNSTFVQRLIKLASEPTHTVNMTASAGFRLVTDLFHALMQSAEARSVDLAKPNLAEQAERIMVRELHLPFSVERLADQMDVSREHLTREFTHQFGVSPHRYSMQLRVREACSRLGDARTSIKSIVQSLGFSSRLTFIRTFKRVMGMTPSEYRSGHRRML